MKVFRKCWNDKLNNWLIKNKDLKAQDAYNLFLENFPDTDITYNAFKSQRYKLRAVPKTFKKRSVKARPLFSEYIKKDYVYIKIAQPNFWVVKSKWVYEQANNIKLEKSECVVFLDGNNRNFDAANLYAVKRGTLAVCNSLFGGLKPNEVEQNLVRIKQAELHRLMLKNAEKIGLWNKKIGFLSKHVERVRLAYQKDKERRKAYQKKYYEKIKRDSVLYMEYREKRREYGKEWARRKARRVKGIK